MFITAVPAIRAGLGIGLSGAFTPIVRMPNVLPADGRTVVTKLRFEYAVEKLIVVAIGIVVTGVAIASTSIMVFCQSGLVMPTASI
jgi:hypothetical protein